MRKHVTNQVGVLFNTQERKIDYFKNGKLAGTAFEDFPVQQYESFYASVSISKAEVELVKFQELTGNALEDFLPKKPISIENTEKTMNLSATENPMPAQKKQRFADEELSSSDEIKMPPMLKYELQTNNNKT